MSQTKYDAIIIGGGHNGLVAACLLAKNGQKVVILEANEKLGGLAARTEFYDGFHSPGVWQETRAFSPAVVEGLELESHGLEFEDEDSGVQGIHTKTGQSLHLRKNADHSASAIAKWSEADARSYFEYREFNDKVGSFLRSVVDSPAPEVLISGTGLWEASKLALGLKMLGNRDMQNLLRTAPMCTADGLGEWFEGDFIKTMLAGPAVLGTWTAPWSPGTHLFQLLSEATHGKRVIGGPAAVIDALERRAQNLGVEIQTRSPIQKVEISGGVATGVTTETGEKLEARTIGASCDPKALFLKLCAPQAVPYRLEHAIKIYRTRGTTAKVSLAVVGDLQAAGVQSPQLMLAGDLDDVERSFDPVKYGELPENPTLEVSIPSIVDERLAPKGQHVVDILFHYAPYDLKVGWTDSSKKQVGDLAKSMVQKYLPGLTIRGEKVWSPKDIENDFRVTGGQIHHGEHALDQFMTRPSGDTARHSTPIEGLFLCGSGSHPNGGLSGRPGLLGAQAMLKH